MNERRTIRPDEDPVCGMTVDIDMARLRGLTHVHEGREYAFCGKGCMLEFRDNSDEYLAASHQPSM